MDGACPLGLVGSVLKLVGSIPPDDSTSRALLGAGRVLKRIQHGSRLGLSGAQNSAQHRAVSRPAY